MINELIWIHTAAPVFAAGALGLIVYRLVSNVRFERGVTKNLRTYIDEEDRPDQLGKDGRKHRQPFSGFSGILGRAPALGPARRVLPEHRDWPAGDLCSGVGLRRRIGFSWPGRRQPFC